jgi:hypothetical protein
MVVESDLLPKHQQALHQLLWLPQEEELQSRQGEVDQLHQQQSAH